MIKYLYGEQRVVKNIWGSLYEEQCFINITGENGGKGGEVTLRELDIETD